MKETNTVNISFNKELLDQIDQIAKEESRSRSELIREAARSYIENKRRWKKIFEFGALQTKLKKISERDIFTEIAKERRKRN